MKKILTLLFILTIVTPALKKLHAELPQTGRNKVAYYAFDATPFNQGKLRLTEFTDKANIVVLFEGNIFELCDSIHYGSDSNYIVTINGGPYKYYNQILEDVQTLRTRGVKVLMNVDDKPAWSTATPFTTYDGRKLDYQQYALLIDSCITAVGLDGISLDIEHQATDNTYYRNVVKELGKYVGPLSSNSTTRIYTAAIFNSYWGIPGSTVIGLNKTIAANMNFIMDMGYFQKHTTRFQHWADSLGNSMVMNGFSHDDANDSLSVAVAWAAWHPNPDKAGVMVFAGNVSKLYTDSIFATLDASITGVAENQPGKVPQEFALLQNYPNPFNPTTTIHYVTPQSGIVKLKVFDVLGNEIATLVEETKASGTYSVAFDGSRYASGMYFAQLTVLTNDSKPYFKTIKMSMIK